MNTRLLIDTTKFVHMLIDKLLDKESICVDATCGNGNDTLFLAGKSKMVYGFDIQNQAIENTDLLLKENNLTNYQLFNESFVLIDELVKRNVDLILFNLGYLPNGDKSITTCCSDTIIAVNKSLAMLNSDGVLIVVMYYGHDEGKKERAALLDLFGKLDSKKFHVINVNKFNQSNCPPEVMVVIKK